MNHGDLSPALGLLRPLVTAVVAGLAGLAVHSTLMLVKDAFGILPGFQPYDDFQRLMGGLGGCAAGEPRALSDQRHDLGVPLCQVAPPSSRREFLGKGSWLRAHRPGVMSTGFFLLAGHGLFGLRMDYGIWPALFMLPMLATFSLALSFTHSRVQAG